MRNSCPETQHLKYCLLSSLEHQLLVLVRGKKLLYSPSQVYPLQFIHYPTESMIKKITTTIKQFCNCIGYIFCMIYLGFFLSTVNAVVICKKEFWFFKIIISYPKKAYMTCTIKIWRKCLDNFAIPMVIVFTWVI